MKLRFVNFPLFCVIALAGYGLPSTGLAEAQFQNEINLEVSEIDPKDVDTQTSKTAYTYYFSPVTRSNAPLSESSFLSKSSQLLFSYGSREDVSDIEYRESDSSSISSHLHYVFANTRVPIVFDLQASKTKSVLVPLELEESIETDSDVLSLQMGIGTYVNENTTVSLTLNRSEADIEDTEYELQVADSKTRGYGLSTKSILQLTQSNWLSLNGEIAISSIDTGLGNDSGDTRALSLGTNYYFNKLTSLGMRFQNQQTSKALNGINYRQEGDIWSVRFNKSLTPVVYFELGLQKFFAEHRDVDDRESLAVSVGARF